MNITIRDEQKQKYYRANVSPSWAKRYDNGRMISCGLTVGEDGLTQASIARLQKLGKIQEITEEKWKHSGCQSRCILRGDSICQW